MIDFVHGFMSIGFGRGTMSPSSLFKTHTSTPSTVTTTLPPWQKRKKPQRGHRAVLQQIYQAPLAAQSYRLEASEDVLPTACSGADINLREAQPHAKRGVAKKFGFHQWSHKNSYQQDRKIARESHRKEITTTKRRSALPPSIVCSRLVRGSQVWLCRSDRSAPQVCKIPKIAFASCAQAIENKLHNQSHGQFRARHRCLHAAEMNKSFPYADPCRRYVGDTS
jgi:hypothetical protein